MSKYFVAKQEAVKVYPDLREVCNMKLKAGRQEYYTRTLKMLMRQGERCAVCVNPLNFVWMEFDHEAGRGANGAHRDDRIEVDGHWQNAAVCRRCNTEKGSKRYHWVDGQYVPVKP